MYTLTLGIGRASSALSTLTRKCKKDLQTFIKGLQDLLVKIRVWVRLAVEWSDAYPWEVHQAISASSALPIASK